MCNDAEATVWFSVLAGVLGQLLVSKTGSAVELLRAEEMKQKS